MVLWCKEMLDSRFHGNDIKDDGNDIKEDRNDRENRKDREKTEMAL